MKKLRPREVKQLAQGHTASNWHSQDPSLGYLSIPCTHSKGEETEAQKEAEVLSFRVYGCEWRI